MKTEMLSKDMHICFRIGAVIVHYELPMENKVLWNGTVSMRSRAPMVLGNFVNLHNATS